MGATVAWAYDGVSTVTATISGVTIGDYYFLSSQDAGTTVSAQATADPLVLTMNTTGVAAGMGANDTFEVEVREQTLNNFANLHNGVIATTVFKVGSTSEFPFAASFSYNGGIGSGLCTVSVTFTVDNAAATYTLVLDTVGGSNIASGGPYALGSSQTLSITTTHTQADNIVAYLAGDQGVIADTKASRTFASGVASGGTTGNPTGGGGGAYDPTSTIDGDFLLAFGNGPLDENPAWVNIGGLDGVSVVSWDVEVGRPSDRDKSDVGQATVRGFDFNGTMDPTNPTSPLYDVVNAATKINPCIPGRVQLFNPVDSTYYPRFTGHVANINYRIADTEEYAEWTITLTDDLDILAEAEVIPGRAGSSSGSQSGSATYNAQQVDDRIRAALADAALSVGVYEWPASKMSLYSGNVAVQKRAYGVKSTILTVVDDACDAEFAGVSIRCVDRFGVFRFRGRLDRFDPTNASYVWTGSSITPGTQTYGRSIWKVGDRAAFTADATVILMQNGQGTTFNFDRGKDNLFTAAYAAPAGIKAPDMPGQLSVDATKIPKFGARSVSFDDLIVDHGDEAGTPNNLVETKKVADYYKANLSTPSNRPGVISFGPESATGPNANVWAFLCKVELCDLFTLKTTHKGGGGFNDDFFVEHMRFTCTPGPVPLVNLDIESSPRAHYTTNTF